MPKCLSQPQVDSYNEHGFVHPITALSGEEAADYRRRFEDYERQHDGGKVYSNSSKVHLLETWAAELASHPTILDAAEDVLGPDLMVWATNIFAKEPHNPAYVSWHQDSTYWGLSKPDVVTVWIALSPATQESGCMRIISGTHKWDQIAHEDTLAPGNLLTRGQDIAVDVDESKAVYMPLEPGQFSLHHIRSVHASSPNMSDDRRIGIAFRYIAPHVKQVVADGDGAWLVRGQDNYGHFVLESPPQSDMDEAAMEEYSRIMKLRQRVLFKGVTGKPARTKLGK